MGRVVCWYLSNLFDIAFSNIKKNEYKWSVFQYCGQDRQEEAMQCVYRAKDLLFGHLKEVSSGKRLLRNIFIA